MPTFSRSPHCGILGVNALSFNFQVNVGCSDIKFFFLSHCGLRQQFNLYPTVEEDEYVHKFTFVKSVWEIMIEF